jgi:orotate phosphoribosyltransferase
MSIKSQYLYSYLDPKSLNTKLVSSKKIVLPLIFDSIAFRGMSGALCAPTLAVRMKKNLIMVRKEGDKNHSGSLVEGFSNSKRYIIVDDFIDSGNTVCEIVKAVKKFSPKAKCIGIIAVNQSKFISLSIFRKVCRYSWNSHFKE